MGQWLPSLIDLPMSLGDHLHDLRRKIIIPIVVLAVVFMVSFAFQAQLKDLMIYPLERAIAIIGPETAKQVGLPVDGKNITLKVFTLAESATTAATVSMIAAITATVPLLLFGIWRFVSVGLTASERRLAFMFVPLGVIFFYAGGVLGYFVGLPYMYAFLIQFTAASNHVSYELRLADYIDDFVFWTVSVGLIMDIPWLVMVLVRVGLVTPEKLAKARKFIVVANAILAACITPSSDIGSLLALFIPMQLLFELGLLASRILFRSTLRAAAAKADDAERG
jgi:sec-independent protein translocase protein TatC